MHKNNRRKFQRLMNISFVMVESLVQQTGDGQACGLR
jgi:hypothetical protein